MKKLLLLLLICVAFACRKQPQCYKCMFTKEVGDLVIYYDSLEACGDNVLSLERLWAYRDTLYRVECEYIGTLIVKD